jgi:hypothetical protein
VQAAGCARFADRYYKYHDSNYRQRVPLEPTATQMAVDDRGYVPNLNAREGVVQPEKPAVNLVEEILNRIRASRDAQRWKEGDAQSKHQETEESKAERKREREEWRAAERRWFEAEEAKKREGERAAKELGEEKEDEVSLVCLSFMDRIQGEVAERKRKREME